MNRWDNIESEFQLYANMLGMENALVELNEIMAGDITDAVRSMSSGIDVVKKLTELAFKTQNIELQEGILNLREKLAEAKEALLNAKEEITTCKEENVENKQKIKVLEKELEIARNPEFKIAFKNGAYYKENENIPYCIGCFDNNKKLMSLNKLPPLFKDIGTHQCPACKTPYTMNVV
jgi:ERCC4-related helicase